MVCDFFLPAFVQLWRKVCAEIAVELQLLFEKWRLLLAGLVFQVNFSLFPLIFFILRGSVCIIAIFVACFVILDCYFLCVSKILI